MNSKLNRFLLSPWAFPLLLAMATAAVIAGTHMYIVDGHGAFNEIFVTQLLDKGLKGGDYAGAAGFAAGFLIARLLEGPLVGVLDLGGSLMTGLGIGIPALLLSSGIRWPIESFPASLALGAIIGGILGALIILVRKVMPDGMSASGTDVMMGAGNATGQWLGPIIIISAITYSIPAGIGSFVGAALFYAWKRPIAGGAILGAMILGSIFPVVAK